MEELFLVPDYFGRVLKDFRKNAKKREKTKYEKRIIENGSFGTDFCHKYLC